MLAPGSKTSPPIFCSPIRRCAFSTRERRSPSVIGWMPSSIGLSLRIAAGTCSSCAAPARAKPASELARNALRCIRTICDQCTELRAIFGRVREFSRGVTLREDGRTRGAARYPGSAEFPVFRDAGRNLCTRFPDPEAAHPRPRTAYRVLPLRQRGQLYPPREWTPARAHFGHAGRRARARHRGPGFHPARQALSQAGAAHLLASLPALFESTRC